MLHFITCYHLLTDDKSEWAIKTLEDMLWACVIDFGRSWDSYLPLTEFSYNSYHFSIDAPPFSSCMGGDAVPRFDGARLVTELSGGPMWSFRPYR